MKNKIPEKNTSQIKKNNKWEEKPQKKLCKICEKLGKKEHYHLESSCWFGIDNKDRERNNIKHVNSEIEVELMNTKQKIEERHH